MTRHHRSDRPLPNSYWVRPGRFAADEYPGARNPAEAASRLETLLGAGIDHFIDLTRPGELAPYVEAAAEARRLDLEVVHERHSITDAGIPRSSLEMAATLDA